MTVHTSPGFIVLLVKLALIGVVGICFSYLIYDIVTGIRDVLRKRSRS